LGEVQFANDLGIFPPFPQLNFEWIHGRYGHLRHQAAGQHERL
jgi:hypothetical protein